MINKEVSDFSVQAFWNNAFKTVTKGDLQGKWSVFFFYPADFTFICPTELEDLANKMESETILHLIFGHYDEAVLLLCRSAGSSLESFFDRIVERKACESEAFFNGLKEKYFDGNLLRLLISSQFHSYFRIVDGGYGKEAAQGYMNAVMRYHFGGWTALLSPEAGTDGGVQD